MGQGVSHLQQNLPLKSQSEQYNTDERDVAWRFSLTNSGLSERFLPLLQVRGGFCSLRVLDGNALDLFLPSALIHEFMNVGSTASGVWEVCGV